MHIIPGSSSVGGKQIPYLSRCPTVLIQSWHFLGNERDAGNLNRAVKHWMIAVTAGFDESLKVYKQVF